jgi:GT2 family glycosyltransferase
LAQLYPHWELCIADDASTRPDVRPLLEAYASRDARIKVVFRRENGHISAATNSGLALASGEFVTFLDHDDILTEHALYMVAEAINRHPEADLIYSDEDKIDARGRLQGGFFKPDWSPDRLRAHNYVNHLSVVRAELVRRAGGLRLGLEGAQDHDLLLRLFEDASGERIHHIPHVLYHWRAHPVSVADGHGAKAYAAQASHRAVADCVGRLPTDGDVLDVEASPFLHRVRYSLPDPTPLVSVIIPTRDRVDLLRTCVEGIRQGTDYPAIEIIIVDNDSRDASTLDYLQSLALQPDMRVLRWEGRFNYAAINNAGAALARGEVLCCLNNDTVIIQEEWLREMVGHALRPDVGAVGPLLRYPDGRVQHGGVVLDQFPYLRLALRQLPGRPPPLPFALQEIRNVAALTGACLVLRRELFEAVGGFDEALAVAYNDVDLCLKLRSAGYWLVFTPFAELVHVHGASRGPEDTPEKRARHQREIDYLRGKWGERATHDPFTNPNLVWKNGQLVLASPSPAPRPWEEEPR